MIREELQQLHPRAEIVPPRFEPVIGAALIALDETGVPWSDEVISNIETSWTSE